MSEQPALSNEEIEALTGRAKPRGKGGASAAAPEAAAPSFAGGEPRAFTFGSGSVAPTSVLPALDRVNERYARRLRDLIEPYFRVKPKVEAEPAVMRPLKDWQAEQPSFGGLSLYALKPLKGSMALMIPAEFVSRMVDAYYGGSGASPHGHAREFTPTEDRVLGRFADQLVVLMAEVWRDFAAVDPQLKLREPNIPFAVIGAGDEPVAVCRFVIKLPNGPAAAIDFVLPVSALRMVESAMNAKAGDETSIRAAEWQDKLNNAISDVRIEARTVLARPELTLNELMQLRVGDVIPVSIPALVPLLVEGRTVAHGSIGEQDGKAALKIERIEPRRVQA